MFIGVDGTGESNDFQYQENNRISLISQLVRATGGMYFRGPSIAGSATHGISMNVVHWILSHRARFKGPLFMAGHSRGGAICILAARQLKLRGVTVECMLLLDAVDRAPTGSAGIIPSNVKYAYHAMRNDEIGSRPLFGHCGTAIERPGKLVKLAFNGTHAAIGGTPWSGVESEHHKDHVKPPWMNKERDYQASNEVKMWAWMMLKRQGLHLSR